MNEIYLVLLTGAGAGVVAAFIGAILLYRNHLRTHSTLHEKVEEERTALQNDLSEMDNEELAETLWTLRSLERLLSFKPSPQGVGCTPGAISTAPMGVVTGGK